MLKKKIKIVVADLFKVYINDHTKKFVVRM